MKTNQTLGLIIVISLALVAIGVLTLNAQTFKGFGDNVVASNKAYEEAPAFNGSVSFAFKSGAFNLSNNLK